MMLRLGFLLAPLVRRLASGALTTGSGTALATEDGATLIAE